MLKEQEFPGCRPGPKRVGEEQKWKMRQGAQWAGFLALGTLRA